MHVKNSSETDLKISKLLASLWMGFYMVFTWMLYACPVQKDVGSGKNGLLFDKASFLAFHKVRVPKGPSPRVPGRSGLCSCSPAWQEVTLQLLVQEIKVLVKWSR